MNCGIYSITSPSGNKYIGSSIDIHSRWSGHRCELSKNRHHSSALQNASNKYGLENLEFKVELICGEKDLLLYEQIYIDYLKPEYNICPIAGRTTGYKHTKESLEKMSKIHKGKILSEEHRAKLRKSHRRLKPNLGKKASEETRAKMSAVRKGRKMSPEAIEKLRQSKIGKPLSEAHKKAISETLKAKSKNLNWPFYEGYS